MYFLKVSCGKLKEINSKKIDADPRTRTRVCTLTHTRINQLSWDSSLNNISPVKYISTR
uniref:Uncharacterized protein n=1 Tax=Helianthus annuus TaxID=4232 RepID=A0A251VIX2_HELAN